MKISWDLVNKSIAAGVAIGIGGFAYLMTGYAWLFPIGLFIVCYYKLNLFTGKVCYGKVSDIAPLSIIWLFNTLSAYVTGILAAYSKPQIIEKAKMMADIKLAEGIKIIPLAILCNIMLFIAVDTYRTNVNPFFPFALIFATMIFVYCGFEHCIANAFYFGAAGMFNINVFLFLLMNTCWNTIGGLLACNVIFKKEIV